MGKHGVKFSSVHPNFLKKGLLEKHNAEFHEGKKAQMSKKKKSKKKKNHLIGENITEAEKNMSVKNTEKIKKNDCVDVHEEKNVYKCSICDSRIAYAARCKF
mgnify:CR=1 FL=1